MLAASGMKEADLNNIPAIYLLALSPLAAENLAPLQDTGPKGFNTIAVMKALMGEDKCFVIDKPTSIEDVLYGVRNKLLESKPVVILYDPDALKGKVSWFQVPWVQKEKRVNEGDLERFYSKFSKQTNGKRVVILVSQEASRYEGIQDQITELSRLLKAPTIHTPTGVSAVSHKNEYAAGYVYLGYNRFPKRLLDGLTPEDTVICIGFEPGEYSLNQDKIKGSAWVITNLVNAYGTENGTFRHRVVGEYNEIRGDIELVLKNIISHLQGQKLDRPQIVIPEDLNEGASYPSPPSKYVNMVEFYRRLVQHLKPGTVLVMDVCMGYKDYQHVTQRPVPGVQVKYVHQGSLMGNSLGTMAGMKVARPDLNVVGVTGDGCFAYIGASLGEVSDYGFTMFVLDNGTHGVVYKGLQQIKRDLPWEKLLELTKIPQSNYVKMAKAQGWRGYNLRHGMPFFQHFMEWAQGQKSDSLAGRIYSGWKNIFNGRHPRSLLVRIPMYQEDDIGPNARLDNLGKQGTITNL
mgnify:CR=1 FL=1